MTDHAFTFTQAIVLRTALDSVLEHIGDPRAETRNEVAAIVLQSLNERWRRR
jgi:hypothetical protein